MTDGDRRNLITDNRALRRMRRQTIHAIMNQLHGFDAHEEFSDLLKEAKRRYSITRVGLFDIDLVLYDFKLGMPKAFFEVKNRYQVRDGDGYAIFDEPQYTFLEDLGHYLGVPVYYIIKTKTKWLVWKVENGLAQRRQLTDGKTVVLLPLEKARPYNHGQMVNRFLRELLRRY